MIFDTSERRCANDAAVSFDLESPNWDTLARALADACETAEIESIEDLRFESTELKVGADRFPTYTAEVKPDDGKAVILALVP